MELFPPQTLFDFFSIEMTILVIASGIFVKKQQWNSSIVLILGQFNCLFSNTKYITGTELSNQDKLLLVLAAIVLLSLPL